MYLKEQTKKEQLRMEEEARELREKEIEEKWRKMVYEQQTEKRFMI